MILQYKLFENIQKAKKILKDKNISDKDPKFLQLKELLKNNLGYIGQFTKWYMIDNESYEKIKEIYNELLDVELTTPIDTFEKLENLYDYIQSYNIDKKVNQVIKSLPSGTRQLVNNELKDLISLNIQYSKQISDFYSKKGGRYKDIKSLIKDTRDYITNLSGEYNLETMLKKIEKYDVDIIISKPETLMIRINDYNASCKLGSKHWCISTSSSYWNSYVNEFTSQYFVYDFTKDISDKEHLLGATISPSGEITSAHYADDSKINDLSIFDSL
jgi:tetratricopeptide (TPR) repeat protein